MSPLLYHCCIESLSVEATGHFNVQRYLGLDTPVAPGYERIGCTVHLKTRSATPEQLEELGRLVSSTLPLATR